MRLRPLQDRVLIRRVEPEAETSGGIIIPDTVKEKPMEGEVVAVGTGARGQMACCTRSMSKLRTVCCSASGRAARSSWMVKTS